MTQSQSAFAFKSLDAELDLATALHVRTGRDLFAGITNVTDRQAAARIAIVMNRLEGEFGKTYETVYGEALPVRQRLSPSVDTTRKAKGKSHG